MAASRTTRFSARPAAVLAVVTLLAAVAALLALSGTAHAQDRNCDDFTYQEEAQAYFDANPGDRDRLDRNNNGIACDDLPRRGSAMSTTTTTSTTATTSSTTPTTSSTTPTTSSTTSTTSTTPTSTTSRSDDPDDNGSDDNGSDDNGSDDNDSDDNDSDDNDSSNSSGDGKDCADFASQADAQAALKAKPSDPDNLDADDDGIACEQHFGETGQQVQVHPTGGVDTGGF